MLLFLNGDNGRIIIPSERLYNIVAVSCSVVVNYEGGEMCWVDDNNLVPKIETVRVTFNSPDEVDKIIRQFYKACNNKVGAFFFGS